ncbi:MAG: hypothetical protein AAFV95_21365 [Bacteroidota bacterium]
MKPTIFLPALFLIVLGLSSCSPKLTPFTQRLQNEQQWGERDLRKIQFYLSDNIVLRRKATAGDSKIESGEIKIVNGERVEEIVIPKGTPGVFLFHPNDKKNRFAVSFESGSDGRYLMFGPNPRSGNRYVLLASEWKRRGGEVTYDGRRYFTPSSSAYAALMVDLKRTKKVSVRSRKAKGRTIK